MSLNPLKVSRLPCQALRLHSKIPKVAPNIAQALSNRSPLQEPLPEWNLPEVNYLHDSISRITARSNTNNSNVPVSSPPLSGISKIEVSTFNGQTHLEDARMRLRRRFQSIFPLDDIDAMDAIEEDTAKADFHDFPTSLDTVMEAIDDRSPWGSEHAAVITSAQYPYNILLVNKKWEMLCGFSQEQAFGKSFGSIGIQSNITEAEKVAALNKRLAQGKHAAVHLTNTTKDGEAFDNYVRIAPLYSGIDHDVTHFIGVLESKRMYA